MIVAPPTQPCCRIDHPHHPPPTSTPFRTDGLSFHVKDPARLEQEVLPKYFRHSRFQSLVRQLNFYDFKVLTYSLTYIAGWRVQSF